MLGGIQLQLMIGPAVPIPVGRDVLDALQSVSVTVRTKNVSVFELKFTLSTRSPLHTIFLLAGGAGIPMVRVIIVVTVNGTPTVLMDGIMTEHNVAPGSDAGTATLTVKGDDLTRVMDYVDLSGTPYPALPVAGRVALILAKYAVLGMVPLVIPPLMFEVPIPTERIPLHEGTDEAFVTKLAQEVGHVFYLEPGPKPGMSIAYWGPEVRVGLPQPALNTNMDAHTNVETLSFNFASDDYRLPVLMIQNKQSKVGIPIPIPDISPLRPPLALIPSIPKGIDFIKTTAKFSAITAALQGIAQSAHASDTVKGEGTLNVLRYGRILQPRRLVGVRGAGQAFDGYYYVDSVTHTIQRGEYKQSFSLVRNGLVSSVQKVVA
jgi:hypothetical protein